MRRRWVWLWLLVAMLVVSGCGGSASTPSEGHTVITETGSASESRTVITEAGSTTVQPLAERLAEAFMAEHPEVEIIVQGGGSSVGVKAAGEGTVDVGAASREIKASELESYPDLQVFVIARDGIAVVVHPDVSVETLTTAQVRGIFSGQITNWQEVGGDDRPIIIVAREEGSGTRAAFEELVMGEAATISERAILQPSNGAVRTTVATTPDAIGFLSFGYLGDGVKAVAVDGVAATEANAANGRYPLVRPLNLLTKGEPQGAVKAWLDFILGEEGQAIVAEEGYIPVR